MRALNRPLREDMGFNLQHLGNTSILFCDGWIHLTDSTAWLTSPFSYIMPILDLSYETGQPIPIYIGPCSFLLAKHLLQSRWPTWSERGEDKLLRGSSTGITVAMRVWNAGWEEQIQLGMRSEESLVQCSSYIRIYIHAYLILSVSKELTWLRAASYVFAENLHSSFQSFTVKLFFYST